MISITKYWLLKASCSQCDQMFEQLVASRLPKQLLLKKECFHNRPKWQQIFRPFCKKNCRHELSKIALSGHTEFSGTEKSFLKAARLTNRGFSLKQNSGCKLFFRDFNEAAIRYDLICVMSRLAIIQVLKFYNRPKFPV